MRVTLTHRLGQNHTGTELDTTDAQGQWLCERGHATPNAPAHPTEATTPTDDTTNTAEADTDALSLSELRTRAEALGLPTYGTKAALTARIADHQTPSTTDTPPHQA